MAKYLSFRKRLGRNRNKAISIWFWKKYISLIRFQIIFINYNCLRFMSLYITIKQVNSIDCPKVGKKVQPKLSLVVRNSKSGALLQGILKFNRLDWNKKFIFLSSFQENIQFVLIVGDKENAQLPQNLLGRGKIYIKKLLQNYQKAIQQCQMKNEAFQYEITLYDEENQEQVRPVGIIKVQIIIDEHKEYQGKVLTNADLDLRGNYEGNPRYVKFYQGKCSKMNLFSLLDQKPQDPNFRCVESIYKDFQ